MNKYMLAHYVFLGIWVSVGIICCTMTALTIGIGVVIPATLFGMGGVFILMMKKAQWLFKQEPLILTSFSLNDP